MPESCFFCSCEWPVYGDRKEEVIAYRFLEKRTRISLCRDHYKDTHKLGDLEFEVLLQDSLDLGYGGALKKMEEENSAAYKKIKDTYSTASKNYTQTAPVITELPASSATKSTPLEFAVK